jgi:hypothetical protein
MDSGDVRDVRLPVDRAEHRERIAVNDNLPLGI